MCAKLSEQRTVQLLDLLSENSRATFTSDFHQPRQRLYLSRLDKTLRQYCDTDDKRNEAVIKFEAAMLRDAAFAQAANQALKMAAAGRKKGIWFAVLVTAVVFVGVVAIGTYFSDHRRFNATHTSVLKWYNFVFPSDKASYASFFDGDGEPQSYYD